MSVVAEAHLSRTPVIGRPAPRASDEFALVPQVAHSADRRGSIRAHLPRRAISRWCTMLVCSLRPVSDIMTSEMAGATARALSAATAGAGSPVP